jgi:hypothetical protein
MIALVLAAATATATAPPATPPRQAEPMPNFFRQPARCGPAHDGVVRRVRTATAGQIGATYAVLRSVDGCGVPTPVGYHPDYLLPGAADPQSLKPAGAPPNRR